MKKIVILGSTGSIGTNALDVVRRNPDRFKVVGIAANENYALLSKQAHIFNVKEIAIYNKNCFKDLKRRVPDKVKIHAGLEGISKVAGMKEADIVLVAIGGTLSIIPLIAAIEAGKDIALASKEAMVSAGELVMRLAKRKNIQILPVDSEHSAVFQCLRGEKERDLKKIYLTGTGGPLRNVRRELFDRLPVSRITKHPKWKMGKKITVDSATLMNKGLEIIEAKWLFSVDPARIEVLLHPEAIIHSMVEFVDGTVMANMFHPDMRFPILYAFSYPERVPNRFPKLDFLRLKNLTFEKPDFRSFPALKLAYETSRSQSKSAVLNSANEEAVMAFLDGKIRFTKIIDIVEKILRLHKPIENPTLKDILHLDKWAKEEVKRFC